MQEYEFKLKIFDISLNDGKTVVEYQMNMNRKKMCPKRNMEEKAEQFVNDTLGLAKILPQYDLEAVLPYDNEKKLSKIFGRYIQSDMDKQIEEFCKKHNLIFLLSVYFEW